MRVHPVYAWYVDMLTLAKYTVLNGVPQKIHSQQIIFTALPALVW